MSQRFTVIIGEHQAALRLDKVLSDAISALTRTRIQELIEAGCIERDGKPITNQAYRVKLAETYVLNVPAAVPSHMVGVAIPLDIVYEDADVIVVNKAAGMNVHPGAGSHQDTLVHALLSHAGKSLSGIGGVERPGIVHRLDKDTSGLLVVAKHDAAHQMLSNQLKDRSMGRTYLAFVYGAVRPQKGTIEKNIGRSLKNRKKMAVLRSGGREAITHYAAKEIYADGAASLVECTLQTGRTHQIRVHLTSIGHALIGDKLYGGSNQGRFARFKPQATEYIKNFPRQALHAYKIKFIHPTSFKTMHFEIPLPEDLVLLEKYLKDLKK